MDVKRDALPEVEKSLAADLVGIPAVLLYRGPRGGARRVPTVHGRRDAFGAHAFTVEGYQGKTLFFWGGVVEQLAAWLPKEDDAVVVTISKEARAYTVTQVTDGAVIDALIEIATPFLPSIDGNADDDGWDSYIPPEPDDDGE